MSFGQAAWHLLNFYAPALGIGLLAATVAKSFWRNALRGVSWGRLALAATAACAAALTLGLLIFGRDGRIATYVALPFASALALWLTGWRGRG